MKKILSAITATLIYSVALGQSNEGANFQDILFQNGKVTVTVTVEECQDPYSDLRFEYYTLSVQNKSSEKLNVQFWSQGHELESDEFFHSLIVEAGQERQGSCDLNPGNSLRFFRRDMGSTEIKPLDLVEFKVLSLD